MKAQRTAFVLAVIVLVIAAVTLNSIVGAMKLHFQKSPVALRKPLDTVPAQLGPWLQVSKDGPLDPEYQDVLGTSKYIFRTYVDTRKLSASELATLRDQQATDDAQRVLAHLQSSTPEAVVSVDVTYYTGMVDTVAHIPDRCYIADGFEPKSHQTVAWNIGQPQFADRTLQVRLINFEDQTPNRGSEPVNVAYFFQCNGSYESDPLNGVRFRLQNLSEKYGYYAKIELKTVMAKQDEAAAVMEEFLRTAMPSIEACLPDWKHVIAQDENEPGKLASAAQ